MLRRVHKERRDLIINTLRSLRTLRTINIEQSQSEIIERRDAEMQSYIRSLHLCASAFKKLISQEISALGLAQK